ncbi:hypothetical protein HC891_24955 [Candidatus Gracilibacteria bacterium]|nr:hypothetical protein [Candidatus Gracilibacteria bacterium]
MHLGSVYEELHSLITLGDTLHTGVGGRNIAIARHAEPIEREDDLAAQAKARARRGQDRDRWAKVQQLIDKEADAGEVFAVVEDEQQTTVAQCPGKANRRRRWAAQVEPQGFGDGGGQQIG